MVTTATPPIRRPAPPATMPSPAATAAARHRHWYWLAAGLALFFLIPFVLTDVVTLERDVYYGVYILSVLAFVGAWIGSANARPRAVLTRNWQAGTALGLVCAGALAAIVLGEPATERPDGPVFVAALIWRGVLYGLADGLILSVFPILAVFAAFAGTRLIARRGGKAAVGALALAVSLLYTAVYHVGYSDFRGELVRKPLAGDVVWSLPTLLTLSPVGAPIAHIGLHVTAVAHSYDTDVFLPPHAAGLEEAPLQRVLNQTVTGPDRLAPGAAADVSTPEGSLAGVAGLANVHVFFPRGASADCGRVHAVPRRVARPAVLTGAMRALVAGPTPAERARGYGGWFSNRTAGSVKSVRIAGGTAYVDFRDFSRTIPNASSSCGSTLLLAQLDRTAEQFPTVRRTAYSFDGSRRAFYEWLQRAAR